MMNWFAIGLFLLFFNPWVIQRPESTTGFIYPFTPVWRFLRQDTLRYVPAVTDGEAVYVLLAEGKILALSLSTGDVRWEATQAGRFTIGPQVDDRFVYAALEGHTSADGSAPHWLLSIDKRTGATHTRRSFEEAITSLTLLPEAAERGLPTLFVGVEAGVLVALADIEHEPAWSFRTGSATRGHVFLDSPVGYVGSDDGHLYALDAKAGVERWRFMTGGAVRSDLRVQGNRLYFGSFDGFVYCLDKASGQRHWRMRTGAAIQARPALVDDLLIVASYDNFVYALDPASGAPRWKIKLSGRIIADPLVRENTILLSVLRDRRLVVLRSSDGKEVNSFELEEDFEIVAPPVMGDGTLILTTTQGLVAARSGPPSGPSPGDEPQLTRWRLANF